MHDLNKLSEHVVRQILVEVVVRRYQSVEDVFASIRLFLQLLQDKLVLFFEGARFQLRSVKPHILLPV